MTRLRRPPTRTPPETIIALVDVVFFLLVFFMLIGRLDATAPFQVTPPVSALGADLPGGGSTISVGADGALALDGAPADEAEILARVSEAHAALPDLRVRINADGAAEARHLLPLAAALSDAGIRDVVLIVTPTPP